MAWDDDAPIILRNLIDDNSASPVYSDDRLITQFLLTVPLLQIRVAFQSVYSADVSDQTLTPDPTSTSPLPRDDSFITLNALLAAKTLISSEVRDLARQGIEIQDGDSRIKLARNPDTLKQMQREYDQMFEDALYAYKTGGNDGLGQVITGPYKYFENGRRGMGGMYEGFRGGSGYNGIGGLY